MNLSSGEVAFAIALFVVSAAGLALYVYALAHCFRVHSDRSRLIWLLVIGLVPFFGSVVYLLIARRPRSEAKTTISPALPPPLVSLPPALSPTATTSAPVPDPASFVISESSTEAPPMQVEKPSAAEISDSIAALARSQRQLNQPASAAAVDRFDQAPRFGSSESLGGMLGALNTQSNAALTPPSEPKSPPVSKLLYGTFLIGGPVAFWLATAAAAYHPNGRDVSYRIGSAIGVVAIWPLIVIGLFSIGRQFRNTRTRIIISLILWGLSGFANLATVTRQNDEQSVTARSTPTAFPPPSPSRTNPASLHFGQPAPVLPQRFVEPPASEFDLSPGSDERLVKTIESARENRYHAIVAAYARACALQPDDATLALERVRFIEQFAYSEDFSIDGSEHDQEVAASWLTTHFAERPVAILYQLERKYGPEFQRAAESYAKQAEAWPAQDLAKLLLLRAQRTTDQRERRLLARRSFELNASITAGLLILSSAEDATQRQQALRILDHSIFKTPEAWQQKQILDFLFKAGEDKRAVALYQEMKAQSPALVQDVVIARQLADSGRIDLARGVLAALPDPEWSRAKRLRDRFEFELTYGDAQQAAAAYKAMCAGDLMADALLRDRFSLLLRHPTAGWSFQDVPRLIVTWLLVVGLLTAPAVLLLPIHYWSLLRARCSRASGWSDAKWGLRDIWVVVGLLVVCEVIALWLFAPEQIRELTNKGTNPASGITDTVLLIIQGLGWAATGVVLAIAFARARAWRLVGPGHWRVGRILAIALACTLGLRIALAGYIHIWPQVLDSEIASFPSVTKQLGMALLKFGGPAGLIAALAVLVPVLEELLFRGLLLQGLAKHIPFGWANLIQALLFAGSHENLRVFPFFVLFGVICGLLARRSGGLLASIIVHAMNNLLVCIAYIAAGR